MLAYGFLFLTILSCFATANRIVPVSLLILSGFAALFFNVVSFVGAFAIAGFYALTGLFFRRRGLSVLNILMMLAIIISTILFAFHMVPGFYNILLLERVSLSGSSVPFSMYLNFDKVMVGLILFINSKLYDREKSIDLKSLGFTAKMFVLCAVILGVAATLSGYVAFDFKLPNILLIWALNNLFFVCFAEEVIFRGIVQSQLKKYIANRYIAILLASLIFGLAHYPGGIYFIILAIIAGFFYGYVFERTQRISCAMLIHFSLNLAHFIFFTYPIKL